MYNGKQQRYKAEQGEKVYLENRRNCRKQYRCLATVKFLQYVVERFKSEDKWSLDASFGEALNIGKFTHKEMVCTKTLYNYVDLGLLPIKNIDLPEKSFTDEQKETFKKSHDCWSKYMSLAEAAIFEYAFKLGMRIAMETMNE